MSGCSEIGAARDRFHRRHLLHSGLGGMIGLSLPALRRLQAESLAAGSSAKTAAVIYVELAGGPAQHETYDPKPRATAEVRGPLRAIPTNVPGIEFSELMAEQAKIADKLAIIRSVTHNSGSHETSAHLAQTGWSLRNNQSRQNEMPCVGAVAAHLRGRNRPGLPAFVAIPRGMRFGGAAWLGAGFAPYETVNDPNKTPFTVPNISLARGLTPERLADRQSLLADLDQARNLRDTAGTVLAMDTLADEAFEMLTGDGARRAFDIDQEDAKIRKVYGRNPVGQSMLLARRLVEHGVMFVTVRVPGWDDHKDIEKSMRGKGGRYDQAIAALVGDLGERGLDRDVLVVAMGEFGRTPKINKTAGRDHWGRVMSVLVAGGGLKMGQVIGATDANGAAANAAPYRPQHVLAMIYRHLGINPDTTLEDKTGRPWHLLAERGLIREMV